MRPFICRRLRTSCVPVACTVAIVFSFHTGIAARASETGDKPFIVRAGVQLPVNSNEAAPHPVLGLAYELDKPNARDSHWAYGIYGEYFFQTTKTVALPNGDFDYVAPVDSYGFDVGLSARYRFHPAASVTPYLGVGIGFYENTLKVGTSRYVYANPFYGYGYSGNAKTVDNGPAGKIMAGAEFRSGLLAEAVLQIFSDNADFSTGAKLGGLGLNLGYRF